MFLDVKALTALPISKRAVSDAEKSDFLLLPSCLATHAVISEILKHAYTWQSNLQTTWVYELCLQSSVQITLLVNQSFMLSNFQILSLSFHLDVLFSLSERWTRSRKDISSTSISKPIAGLLLVHINNKTSIKQTKSHWKWIITDFMIIFWQLVDCWIKIEMKIFYFFLTLFRLRSHINTGMNIITTQLVQVLAGGQTHPNHRLSVKAFACVNASLQAEPHSRRGKKWNPDSLLKRKMLHPWNKHDLNISVEK